MVLASAKPRALHGSRLRNPQDAVRTHADRRVPCNYGQERVPPSLQRIRNVRAPVRNTRASLVQHSG